MYVRKSPSGRWKAEIHLPSGRKVSRTFDTKREAEAWGRSQRSALDRGDFVDPAKGRIRLNEWARDSVDSWHNLAPSTRARYEIALRHDIEPVLGNYRLAAIDHDAVQHLVNRLVDEKKAPASIRKTYSVLSKVMKRAVSAGRIPRTPCEGIELPRISHEEMRFLSATELDLLVGHLEARYQVPILVAGYVGLRWSELIALTRDDLELPAGRLRITHALVEVNGHFYEGPPKTPKSIRAMTLPGFLAQAVGEHMGLFPSQDGRVFSAAEGGPLRKSFARRYFKPAVAAAGLAPFRIHDLRHTAAGLMIAEGAHELELMKRLGHSSIQVTHDRYGHLMPDRDEALSARLDALARRAAASLPPDARSSLVLAGRA